MHPKKSRSRIFAQVILGLAFLCLAIAIFLLWPWYYQRFVADELKMSPTSNTFKMWSNSPLPIIMDFYFFNWTNQASLQSEGAQHIPRFQELGPYRFREKVERVNVTWNDNGTVTYQQAKWWYFDPEHSKGSLEDKITTLNVVSLTAATKVQSWNYVLRVGTSGTLRTTGQTSHIEQTVGELLFIGYSDKLIDMARTIPLFKGVEVPFDKFGWFYKRNGTTTMDGVFNMNTGEEDIQQMGKLENWKYRNSTDYFQGECGQIKGTTGQLFPPGQTKEKRVEMFSPDLCRSVGFEYEEESEVQGVPGYKYVGGVSMMDNGTLDPSTECYCNGECVPVGVTNLTVCRFGAPAFASYPHFYLADPLYTSFLRGIKPVKEKHQFYLILEPTTGIPLDVAARLQINVLLQPLSDISMYEDVPTVLFPMLWFEQRATLTSELAGPLRLLLFLKHLGVFLTLVSAAIAFTLLAHAACLWLRMNRVRQMQLTKKGMDDSRLYVATIDQHREKVNSNDYIVMKPKSKLNIS